LAFTVIGGHCLVFSYEDKGKAPKTPPGFTIEKRLEIMATLVSHIGSSRKSVTSNTLSGMEKREALTGYLFIAPTLIGILIFTAGPVLVSIGLSLFKWNVFSPLQYIGFDNFTRIFNDAEVTTSFLNTMKFVLMAVSLQIGVGILLAIGVNNIRNPILKRYFRISFFMPLISGGTIAIVMSYLFHKDLGAVNYYLNQVNILSVPWLSNPNWALITVVIVAVWQATGYNFILFTGAMQNISRDVQDAADVDGAQGFTRLWNITLPMVSPSILFAAVTGAMGALQVFDIPYILTRGGPGDSTRTAVMVIQQAAFKNLEIGYGAAVAVILFILIMIVTMIQFRVSKSWVFYQ
jgi:multiple sugar transport system permease protein